MLKFAAILMLFVLVCLLLALQVRKNEKTFRRGDTTKVTFCLFYKTFPEVLLKVVFPHLLRFCERSFKAYKTGFTTSSFEVEGNGKITQVQLTAVQFI